MRICCYVLILVITFCLPAFSQETFTITTYYPAPFGVYTELRSKRMAIGDNYFQQSAYHWGSAAEGQEITADADLVVEGNMGIGTYQPNEQLEVSKRFDGFAGIRVSNPSTYPNAATGIDFDITGQRARIVAERTTSDLVIENSLVTSDSDIHFKTSAGTPDVRMTVKGSGEVGVGTTTPQAKLDVNGGVRVGIAGVCSDNAANCGADTAGTMRYCNNKIEFCNGSIWLGVGLGSVQAVTVKRYENKDKPLNIESYIGPDPGDVNAIAEKVELAKGPDAWSTHKLFGLRCKNENGWVLTSEARAAAGSDNDAFIFNNTFWGDSGDATQNQNVLYVICTKMQ